MEFKSSLSEIADTYLAQFALQNGCTRPLTRSQLADAQIEMHDALAAVEIVKLIDLADAQDVELEPSPLEYDANIANAVHNFIWAYKAKIWSPEPLDGDETEMLARMFLTYADMHEGNV